ncbi:cupin domain-containing protein [Biomaibacter acetigenes]|uniref:Cupin domain-containing protein n=1 Tax=Biomaibacter acetigenes TaxID=2316383 RepID=A0A3G2R6N3_9FIRM|nr:cupin domain-containing protein [Biomaibacter acetigenes]AYO31112.1 cupin domain-containing protein [Biomaibacter acetigenes]
MTETEYIKDLTKVSVNGYDFADYKHLFKLDKIVMSHVSVKPGESVPPHVHDNEEQTYWIIKGIGKIRLGNEEYDVCGGQAVYTSWHRTYHKKYRARTTGIRVFCCHLLNFKRGDLIAIAIFRLQLFHWNEECSFKRFFYRYKIPFKTYGNLPNPGSHGLPQPG